MHSYKNIITPALTFLAGVTSAFVAVNLMNGENLTLTTLDIINFAFSLVLSAASIVLAVVAISLSRSSEETVVRRSDESIRLQTELFTKTTEALQRIESSTGVTEKRVEDIIQGRVGDLSHQIAQMTIEKGRAQGTSVKNLEENIRKSLLQTIASDSDETRREKAKTEMAKRRQEEQKKESIYQDAHKKLLLAFANADDVKVHKFDHGNPDEDGDEAFDGVFSHKGKRFAVVTFRPDADMDTLKQFLLGAALQIKASAIRRLYVVLFDSTEERMGDVSHLLSAFSSEIASNVQFVRCHYSEIDDTIKNLEIENL